MKHTSAELKQQFLLDPTVIFLNHGSFGATPIPVFESYQHWQLELERQPVEFLGRKAPTLLAEARAVLADYLGTARDNLVFVTNVTEGLNIVARSLDLGPQNEVLTTNMEYGALDRTWRFLAQKRGFKYINQSISIPVQNEETFIEDLWKGVSPHTKIIFLSHITSPTAIILPVQKICARARHEGILTVIDGAHAPGQVDIDLEKLGADFYSANCHKWLCAPKGSGFLYARPEVQHLVEPLVVSWGWQSDTPGPSRFVDILEWCGTRDLAAFLAVPAAIQFQKNFDWAGVRASCHSLAGLCLRQITHLTGLGHNYPDFDSLFAQMAAAPLPSGTDMDWLRENLYRQYRIEIPLIVWNQQNWIRFSFQGYNNESDLEALVSALKFLLSHAGG
jgi:isopenicillin-N epimerase